MSPATHPAPTPDGVCPVGTPISDDLVEVRTTDNVIVFLATLKEAQAILGSDRGTLVRVRKTGERYIRLRASLGEMQEVAVSGKQITLHSILSAQKYTYVQHFESGHACHSLKDLPRCLIMFRSEIENAMLSPDPDLASARTRIEDAERGDPAMFYEVLRSVYVEQKPKQELVLS